MANSTTSRVNMSTASLADLGYQKTVPTAKPIGTSDGLAKCHVHTETAAGLVCNPANGPQAILYAFSLVTSKTELEALLNVAEQAAVAAAKRLEGPAPAPKPEPSPVAK